jgi:HAD superfamily hydrolase (TIGR01549 family)
MDREKKKLIFFDFDGVIADSFIAAFTVSKMIHPLLKQEDYRRRFDGNVNEAAVDGRIQKEYRSDVDFFEEYKPLLLESPIFPAMRDVVRACAKKFSLVIISSTTTPLISAYLKKHHIERYFEEIMGNDVHKSKIKKIGMALAKYKIIPNECLFVTDTVGDIKESRSMGVKAAAVTWGYHSRKSLERADPFVIIDTTQELFDLIERLP